jgi:hypothetical protein
MVTTRCSANRMLGMDMRLITSCHAPLPGHAQRPALEIGRHSYDHVPQTSWFHQVSTPLAQTFNSFHTTFDAKPVNAPRPQISVTPLVILFSTAIVLEPCD